MYQYLKRFELVTSRRDVNGQILNVLEDRYTADLS